MGCIEKNQKLPEFCSAVSLGYEIIINIMEANFCFYVHFFLEILMKILAITGSMKEPIVI